MVYSLLKMFLLQYLQCIASLVMFQIQFVMLHPNNRKEEPAVDTSDCLPNIPTRDIGPKLNDPLDDDECERVMPEIPTKTSLVFPGTKWCGKGNIAENDQDLGELREVDACCRDHDLCPIRIDPGKTKYGLTNTGSFTRVHCDCDLNFHRCLKGNKDKVSRAFGVTYFDVLGSKCFKKEHPIIKCDKYYKWFSYRCKEHKKDTQGLRVYQFFDVPFY